MIVSNELAAMNVQTFMCSIDNAALLADGFIIHLVICSFSAYMITQIADNDYKIKVSNHRLLTYKMTLIINFTSKDSIIMNAFDEKEYDYLVVNSVLLATYYTKDEYLDRVGDLPKKEPEESRIFIDSNGFVLTIGKDFNSAIESSGYPVRVYQNVRTSKSSDYKSNDKKVIDKYCLLTKRLGELLNEIGDVEKKQDEADYKGDVSNLHFYRGQAASLRHEIKFIKSLTDDLPF